MGSSEFEVLNKIKGAAESLSLWFQNICMKMNSEEFRLLLGDRNIQQVSICNEKLSSMCCEKLLGIKK